MRVALLHAWPHDETMWERQTATLAGAGHEPLTPRLYGRGPSVEGWAAQLLGELEAPLVAVGASMGGYTSLALARRAPERVLGIVLAGSRAGADSPERRRERDAQIAALRADGVPADLDTGVGAEELAVAQEAIRDRPDATGVVASFGGPLLVCHGDRDEVVPAGEARSVAESALQGSFVLVEDAGHLVSLDQPERFDAVLLDFLAQWT